VPLHPGAGVHPKRRKRLGDHGHRSAVACDHLASRGHGTTRMLRSMRPMQAFLTVRERKDFFFQAQSGIGNNQTSDDGDAWKISNSRE
jgi:hypothetical protein